VNPRTRVLLLLSVERPRIEYSRIPPSRFEIVWHRLKWCRKHGIRTGPRSSKPLSRVRRSAARRVSAIATCSPTFGRIRFASALGRWACLPVIWMVLTASVAFVIAPALTADPAGASGAPPGALTASATAPKISHVVIVMEENKEWSTVWQYGPYERKLAETYVNYSNFYGIRFPSWTDYIAPTSGQSTTFQHVLPTKDTSLGHEIEDAGLSWQGLEENMPAACDPTTNWASEYDTEHNPFIWYADIAGSNGCDSSDVPFTLSGWDSLVAGNSIANYTWVTPDVIDDGHNASANATCPLAAHATGTQKLKNEVCHTDEWLEQFLAPLFKHPTLFDSTAVFILYDSGSKNLKEGFNQTAGGPNGGHVYAVLVNPLLGHAVATHNYTEYDLLTTSQYLLGLKFTLPKNDNPTPIGKLDWPVMYPWPAAG
jgi:hypothetical protein